MGHSRVQCSLYFSHGGVCYMRGEMLGSMILMTDPAAKPTQSQGIRAV